MLMFPPLKQVIEHCDTIPAYTPIAVFNATTVVDSAIFIRCLDAGGLQVKSSNIDSYRLRNKTYVPVFYRGNKIWIRVQVRMN